MGAMEEKNVQKYIEELIFFKRQHINNKLLIKRLKFAIVHFNIKNTNSPYNYELSTSKPKHCFLMAYFYFLFSIER